MCKPYHFNFCFVFPDGFFLPYESLLSTGRCLMFKQWLAETYQINGLYLYIAFGE